MSKEAMKLALEALEPVSTFGRVGSRDVDTAKAREAITALRKALANEALDKKAENARELGLDYEVEPKIGCVNHDCDKCKALAEQPAPVAKPHEQEPVAWLDEYGNAFPLAAKQYSVVGKHWKPLYTSQPQRTWVGLTDEEIKPCWHEACQTDLELTSQLVVYFAKAIEAKLKEMNK